MKSFLKHRLSLNLISLELIVLILSVFTGPSLAADPPGNIDPFATAPLLLLDQEMVILSQNKSDVNDIISDVFLPNIVSDDKGNRMEWSNLSDRRVSWSKRPGLWKGKIGDAAVLLRDSTNGQFLAQVWNDLTFSLAPIDSVNGYGDDTHYTFSTLAGDGAGVVAVAGDLDGDRATELVFGYRRVDGRPSVAAVALGNNHTPIIFDGTGLPEVSDKSGLRITAGDLDSDGRSEIGAMYVSSDGKYVVALLNAQVDVDGKVKGLNLLGSYSLDVSPSVGLFDPSLFDIALPDWDGNGKAKVFCVFRPSLSRNEARKTRLMGVEIKDGKAVFSLDARFSRDFLGKMWDGNPDPVRTIAGDMGGKGKDEILFTVNPTDLNQTALVGVYHRDDGSPGFTGAAEFDRLHGGDEVHLKAGSFTGSMYPSASGKNRAQAVLTLGNMIYLVTLQNGGISQKSGVEYPSGALRHSQILIGDLDRDSMLLGDPTHIVLEDNVTPILLLNEPPKHIDPDGSGKVVNYTRQDDLYIQYAESEEKSKETTNTLEVENNMGGSISSEVKVGVNLGVAKVGASIKATYERSTQEKRQDISKEFSSMTASLTGRTERDDFVLYRSHRVDIWRYPVLGWTSEVEGQSEKKPTYYQMVIPDSRAESQAIHLMAGRNVDWYHPVHMNGSVLSYPSYLAQIEDLKDENLLSSLVVLDVGGGNSSTRSIEWKNESSRESLKSVSNKMGGDVEVQITAKAKYFAVKAQTTIKGTFHRDERTTTTGTSRTSVSKQNAFDVRVPAISSTLGYSITPLMYRTDGGVLKTPHTVGNIVGKTAWEGAYGGKPDPALNLPRLWQYGEKGWEWKDTSKTNPDGRKIRGIFFRNDKGVDLGKFLPLGETVTVALRVHNLSLVDCPPVEVHFEAVRYNPDGKPVSIGTVKTPLIARWGASNKANWEWAIVQWNTSGMEAGNYRVQVTVNSGRDGIKELPLRGYKESYDNNQGWYDVCLAKDPNKVAEETELPYHEINQNLVASSLAVANLPDNGKIFEPWEIVMFRGTVKNEGVLTKGNISLLLYDGDPAKGGKAFANPIISGIQASGEYSFVMAHAFDSPVPHRVYMVVVPNEGDLPEDNVVSVSLSGDSSGSGCSVGSWGTFGVLLFSGLIPLTMRRKL